MKDPLAAISVEAINARATALLELGDALQQGVFRAFQELERQNWAAKILDWFSGLWDGDVKSKLADNVADSLTKAFETAQPTASTKAAREKIEGILGTAIGDAEVSSIVEGLIKAGDTDKVKQITDLIKTLGDEQKASASKATELRESMSKVTKTIQEFNRNLKPKDTLYDIATDGTDAIIKLNRALQDPVQSLNAMRDVATNLDLLSVFPEQVALNLQSYGTELKNLTSELGTSQQVLQVYDDQIASINRRMDAIRSGDMGTAGSAAEAAASEQLTKLQNQISELQKAKQVRLDVVFNLKNREGEIKSVFDRAVGEGMLYNAELAAQRLNKEFVAARGIIGKYIADRLSGTRLGIEVQADLEKQRIDAEFSNTQAMYNLSLTMDKLRIINEKQLLQETRKTLEGERAKAVASASTGGAPEDAERRALQAGVSFDQKLGELDRRMEALGRSEDFITRIRSGDVKGVPTAKGLIEGTRTPMEFRGTGGQIDVSQIDPGMLENIRRYEEFRLQQFKKTQEQKLVELKKQNEIEDLTFKRQQEALTREQEKLDKTRQTVGLLTQASGLNSKILSDLDSQLAREQLNLDIQKQTAELDRDEASYRKNVDELLNRGNRLSSEELKKKSAAVAEDNKALKLRRNALNTSSNQQAVIQLIKDAEKEVTRELEKQAKARERQLALQQLENEKSGASRALNKTRLGIVKETGVLSNTNIAIQENALELADRLASQEERRREELNNQTKELQPFRDAIKGIKGTLDAIDTLTPDVKASIDPRAIKALKAALKENETKEQEINNHYKERSNIIKAIFEIENQSADLRSKDALIVAKFADSERERLKQVENIGLKRQAEDVGLDFDIQRLDLLKSQDQITQDVYDQTMRGFQQIKRERELENRELEITNKYTAERLRLQNELNRAEAAGNGWVDVGTASRVQKEMDDLTTREALERGIIDRTRQGYRLLDAETKNLTERQRGYEEAFKNSFENMADAMVEFAKTGKFEFKEMVNSLIADLLRLEYKMQMQELYKAVRPGIGNFFSNLLGSSSLPGAGPTAFVGPQAKGGVFENMNYFAKGGAFTNSIVDNPTIFRFAKGVGMMGEAGPEAIMPLKRDSSGNLGVRAEGGKTEVVVNNYTSERAEARETVDSRGNRRVEVVVGDMTAGEVGRGGSSMNRSMRSSFNLQPTLVRR